MVTLTIRSKDLDNRVNYINPVKTLMSPQEEQVSFMSRKLFEEVMSSRSEVERRKKIKKLKKIMRMSISMLAGTSIGTKAFAAEATTVAVSQITPQVILQWGLSIALISVAAGVAASMVLLTIAGVYRMLGERKRKESMEWTQDIVRGLVQVLIAVPTVYLLYFLAQFLFKNLPMLSGLF